MCSNNAEPVQNQMMMRILGGLALVFGIIEIVIGFIIYFYFTDLHLGGWWGAILTVIAGFLALFSTSRGIVTATCIIASIGVVIAVIAAIVDGISSTVFRSFTGCCNGGYECWGSNDGVVMATACVGQYYGVVDTDCYCTDATSLGGSYTCWDYSLTTGTNCNGVLTTYPSELSASTAMLSFGAITLLILSIAACSALCCAKPSTTVIMASSTTAVSNPSAVAPGTPVVIVSPMASAPVYGQPQYGQPQYGQPQYGQPQPQYVAQPYGQPQVAYAVDNKY